MGNAAPTDLVPSPANPDTFPRWSIVTSEGLITTGYQPSWSAQDPTEQGVPLDDLASRLRDILHWTAIPGELRPRRRAARPDAAAEDEMGDWVFASTIECRPYDEDPARRVPTVSFHLTEQCWLEGLTPQDVADLAAQLRRQADRLQHDVGPALDAARADWAAHHTPDLADTTEPIPADAAP
jgi:hypothetical protein